MGIVGEGHSQSQTVSEHRCHGDDTLPRQVCRILDTTRDRAGTGAAHTDGADILITAVVLNQHDNPLAEYGYEIVHVRIIDRGEGVFRQYITSNIYNSIGGQLVTDINANHFRLDVLFNHNV